MTNEQKPDSSERQLPRKEDQAAFRDGFRFYAVLRNEYYAQFATNRLGEFVEEPQPFDPFCEGNPFSERTQSVSYDLWESGFYLAKYNWYASENELFDDYTEPSYDRCAT